MIKEPTLFILGAGASKPYGYPTGRELRKQIINDSCTLLGKVINRSRNMEDLVRKRHRREAKKFVRAFEKSSVESIDKWLSQNPTFSYYGKIAITLCIIQNEVESVFCENMLPPILFARLVFVAF
jgi:hypothetical protein